MICAFADMTRHPLKPNQVEMNPRFSCITSILLTFQRFFEQELNLGVERAEITFCPQSQLFMQGRVEAKKNFLLLLLRFFAGPLSASNILVRFTHQHSPLVFQMKENSTHKLTESYEYKDYNREIERFWRFILCFPAFAFNMDFLRHPTIASVSKQQHRNYIQYFTRRLRWRWRRRRRGFINSIGRCTVFFSPLPSSNRSKNGQ